MSPGRSGGKKAGLSGAVRLVVRTFLEQKHYRQLHRVLSEQWSSCHSLTAAVRLMEAHGVKISPEEEKRLALLPEERMIDSLVQRMPQQSREQFEHFFLQLSLIASTTTRLRTSLEAGDTEAIDEVLESAENVGILGFILKMAVAQAGQEVKSKEAAHDDWLEETDQKMEPLLKSQAQAMVSQKALAQAKAQLNHYQGESTEKSRSVLLAFIGAQTEAFKGTVFTLWAEHTKRNVRETKVRKEYDWQITAAQQALDDFKAKQLQSLTGILNRDFESGEKSLLAGCVKAFKDEVADRLAERITLAKTEATELQLKSCQAKQRAGAASVLHKMNLGNDEMLLAMCFKGFVYYTNDSKQAQIMEGEVKAAENKLDEFQKQHKESSTQLLARMMAGGTDTGLMRNAFDSWMAFAIESREEQDFQEEVTQKSAKCVDFSKKNKAAAEKEMLRAMIALDSHYIVFVLARWKREVKVEQMRRYGKEKNMKRKQQLIGVKGLFKNFASELENGLKQGTPRIADMPQTKPSERPAGNR
jgi:hypothetical protein